MNERKQVDTDDVELARIHGGIDTLIARLDGLASVFTTRADSLDERFCDLRDEIRETERRNDRRAQKLEARIRALEQRPQPPASMGLSRQQKTALIAILAAIASALGIGGGVAGRELSKPPAQEAKQ